MSPSHAHNDNKIPPPERAALMERLQSEIDRLIAAAIPTSVHTVAHDQGKVAALCLGGACDISHLDPSKPVRVVCVAGETGTFSRAHNGRSP